MVDGARQNFQKSGHGANGTFYFDTEMLRAVDVTRGPSATIYGSGAIGGVVNFTTLDADDVLDEDETVAVRLKTTLETNAPSAMIHGEAAVRLSDSVDVVGAATWRDAGDYEAGGGEAINSAQDLVSGLAKARFRPTDAHDVTLSALHYDSSFDNALVDTASSNAVSDTYTLGYRYTPDNAWADLTAKTYYTTTRVTHEDKDEAANPTRSARSASTCSTPRASRPGRSPMPSPTASTPSTTRSRPATRAGRATTSRPRASASSTAPMSRTAPRSPSGWS